MNERGRLLIVDDLKAWRNLLVKTLQDGGFYVDAVPSSAEAFARLKTNAYHLIVLDIRMSKYDPDNIDGITLLEELNKRGLNKATKVIILSAYGTQQHMRLAFKKYGVVDFLSKMDFDNEVFLKIIQQVFSEHLSNNLSYKTDQQPISEQIDLTIMAPYIITGPTPTHFFFGREPMLHEITQHLTHTSYLIIGGRRIGKTSIINHLHLVHLPAAGFRSIYHDCSTTPGYESFLKANVIEGKPGLSLETSISFRTLFQSLPNDRPLALLLDEADKLVPTDRKDGWPIFNMLRALVNSGQAHIILSGERMLREAMKENSSPLYNFGSEILVGRLKWGDVEKLVTQPMKDLEINLIDEKTIVDYIWNFSSGHPNVVQRLCRRLIELLNERSRRLITLDDVEEIVEDPKFQRDDFLSIYWDNATLIERILSLLLAKVNQQPYRLLDIRHLLDTQLKLVDPNGQKPSGIEIDAALSRLVDLRSILDNTQQGYIFAISAFPRVIARPNVITVDDLLDIYSEAYHKYGDLTLDELTARELP